MTCPHCNSVRVEVVCTACTANGERVRRKHCLICEHRWYTVQLPEVVVSAYDVRWPSSRQQPRERVVYLPTARTPA